LKFSDDGQIDIIGVKRSRNPTARPTEKEEVGPLFSRFEQSIDDGPFAIEINPKTGLPTTDWISDFQIFKVSRGNVEQLPVEFSFVNGRQYQLSFKDASVITERDANYFAWIMFDESIRQYERRLSGITEPLTSRQNQFLSGWLQHKKSEFEALLY